MTGESLGTRTVWPGGTRAGEARDPARPFLFSVVFWVVFATTTAVYLLSPGGPARDVLFGANLVLVAGLWLALPWDPSEGRRVVAPAFLLATLTLGITGSAGTHMLMTLIAITNLAFLYGMRTAVTILVAVSAGLFAAVPLLFGKPVTDAALQVAVFAIFAAFVLGMASAVMEARLRREEAQGLLERIRELAVAEERARMAAEMHDSIGHHLTVIKMGLENAERFRDRRPDAVWDEIRQAKQLTVEALADARRWVRALRPLALDGRVGSTALARLAASFDGTGITVTFEVRGEERPLESDTELVLYRVLQEGLTNALRHARAENVRGELTFGDGRVTLVITDDGRGRDPRSSGGFGLTSLAERTRALGGVLTGHGPAGGGFELRAELPSAASDARS
ncbi:sensor histidine kinase [Sphaerisporangium corydalis]|uniref:histidine kinase n=1 Tax=Sphaerisporangium corydalis TaxID=1441875 RepID=A0ABV9ER45_9ACTN|nr:sensor histidine kinase [Sphaerisporangium corydalis]